MTLRDHFHPPLYPQYDWHSFHNACATTMAYDLNGRLPERYFAQSHVQFGIEIDVATFERQERGAAVRVGEAVAVLDAPAALWVAPPPSQSLPMAPLDDLVEVQVFGDVDGDRRLIAAIELVSPANKDRPGTRAAFVSKCAGYVPQGVGLVIVDIVAGRRADLHNELLERIDARPVVSLDAGLYATSYRPVVRAGRPVVDVWQEPMAVGRPLPVLPLWLRDHVVLPVDLPATYDQTCRGLRLLADAGAARPSPAGT